MRGHRREKTSLWREGPGVDRQAFTEDPALRRIQSLGGWNQQSAAREDLISTGHVLSVVRKQRAANSDPIGRAVQSGEKQPQDLPEPVGEEREVLKL